MIDLCRKILIGWLFLFLTSGTKVHSQNLVPNPSFEDTLQCPDDLDQVNRLKNWFATDGTPDFYNSCFTQPIGLWNVDVPANSFGYQMAFDGQAYIGLATFYSGGGNTIREAVGVQLNAPLQPGTKYFLSFYVTLSNSLQSWCAANNLGAWLTSQIFSSGVNPTPRMNQSQMFSNVIIIDTLNWTLINLSFVADSSYSYLYLGNFFSDSLTNFVLQGPDATAYYFLDNVCLSTDSLYCQGSIQAVQNPERDIFKVFPNPFSDEIHIKYHEKNINYVKCYDLSGKEVNFNLINLNNEIVLRFLNHIESKIIILKIVFYDKVLFYKLLKK